MKNAESEERFWLFSWKPGLCFSLSNDLGENSLPPQITYLHLGGNQERESRDLWTQPLSPLCPPSRQTLPPLGIAETSHQKKTKKPLAEPLWDKAAWQVNRILPPFPEGTAQ